jgi:hypothetical protein
MDYAKRLGLDTSNSGAAHLIRKAGLSHDGGSEGKVLERKVCRKADGGGVAAEYKKGGRIKRAMGGYTFGDNVLGNPDPFGLKKGGKVCKKADGGGVAAEYKKGGPTRKSKNKDIRYLERDERYDVKTHRGKNAHHAVEDIIHDMKPLHKAAGGAAKKRLYGI